TYTSPGYCSRQVVAAVSGVVPSSRSSLSLSAWLVFEQVSRCVGILLMRSPRTWRKLLVPMPTFQSIGASKTRPDSGSEYGRLGNSTFLDWLLSTAVPTTKIAPTSAMPKSNTIDLDVESVIAIHASIPQT